MENMVVPHITVNMIDPLLNVSFITKFLDPEFLAKNKSRPFSEGVYELLPSLRGKIEDTMTKNEIYNIVEPIVLRELSLRQEELNQRIDTLQQQFQSFDKELLHNMLSLFHATWPKEQEEIICYVGYIPRCPRNCVTKEFFVTSSMDIETNIKASIHEINHFVFYEKWKQMHGFPEGVEPMHPEILWFLEELIVDPTLNEPMLQEIVPIPQKAYEQFYVQKIEGTTVMTHVNELYKHKLSIEQFLEEAHEFIKKHHLTLVKTCG
ncbi:hypothetical protein [Lachnoclostridium sp.]|uniref:hypothetical protein n=1 Tax=Lachnoclostridium sp. TaxID=2028282 RepID=UPI00289FF05D|nr:hypothetical protein [Lachnoclostridium sp.]